METNEVTKREIWMNLLEDQKIPPSLQKNTQAQQKEKKMKRDETKKKNGLV